MSEDILGYQRNGRPLQDMASSEYAVITLGNGVLTLAQSLTATYNQQVRPAFVLGDSSIYWLNGYQEGSVELSRLAGGANFFSAFQAGNCGIISAITLSLSGGRPCATTTRGASGTLRFADGIIASLGIRMTAGQSEIVENATVRVATVSN